MGVDRDRDIELIESITSGLAEALAVEGYGAAAPLDPEWGVWFTSSRDAGPQTTAAFTVGFEKLRYGGIGMDGHVSIQSSAANELLLSTPPGSWLDRDTEESLRYRFIDSSEFAELGAPPRLTMTHRLSEPSQVEDAVGWFMEFVTGQGRRWIEDRNSIEKLVRVAKTPNAGSVDNIRPRRFRAVVALCIVNDRTDEAAAMMNWYLKRGRFNILDSMDRASAFDAALAELSWEYSRARNELDRPHRS